MVFTKAMPAGKDTSDSSSNNNNSAGQRTTFRPPWVKEAPNPLPVPTTPWTLKNTRRDSNKETPTENPLAGVQLRKTSMTQKEPQENGTNKENSFKLPQLKPVPPKDETQKPQKDHKLPPIKLNSVAERQRNEPRRPSLNKQKTLTKDDEIDRAVPAARHALVREESMRRLSQTSAPAPPPLPPPPPPPDGFEKKPLSRKQQERIEQLKNRPKVRPDWTAMLKEIESNKKLKHVECNDRSKPLLPKTKATEHFVFESEKENVHNELLKQIQSGIKLKKVKTNDRSKPMLEGLRKFRRQMTIEEQIQKSVSMASIPPEEIADEADEMDDIDKVRDDLQSTKQMLALELRNKEAQERENKRLLSRIQLLEAELEKERCKNKGSTESKPNAANEKLIESLKKEAEQARKTSEEAEKKFTQMGEQLDKTKSDLEETRKQNQLLERRIQELLTGKRQSISNNGMMNGQDSDDEMINEPISDESDDGGDDTEEKREKRAQRELKQLRNKLRNYKNKEDNARKERIALREIIKKHQQAIKEEKKKYKALQKEVDKISALMKDDEDEDEDDDEDNEEEQDDEQQEEEEEEESSEESESDDTDDDDDDGSDSERSQSEAEDAPIDKKKSNLTARVNRHENILSALKKGNFMLKTNAERLQDDLNKQKEMTASLQEDLDSVLSELG